MWKIKSIGLSILCFCTLLLWYNTITRQQQAVWFNNSVSVYWEDKTGASPQQISKLLNWQKEDDSTPPELVLWKPHFKQTLYGDLLPTPVIGEVLEYYGEISRLLPCQFQAGYWPGDIHGCAIDDGIAHALWGSSDVLGRSLQWNGVTWYVRGVIKGTNHLAVFPAEETSKSPFSGIWIDLSKEKGGFFVEQLLQRYQLPLGTITDLSLFVWLTKIIANLPVFLLWGWIIFHMADYLWHLYYTKILFFLSVPLLPIAAAISRHMGFSWSVPDRFLPTKWSDSSFWSELGKQIFNGIQTIFRTSFTVWEKIFWTNLFYCCISAVLTLFFLWLIIIKSKKYFNKKENGTPPIAQ